MTKKQRQENARQVLSKHGKAAAQVITAIMDSGINPENAKELAAIRKSCLKWRANESPASWKQEKMIKYLIGRKGNDTARVSILDKFLDNPADIVKAVKAHYQPKIWINATRPALIIETAEVKACIDGISETVSLEIETDYIEPEQPEILEALERAEESATAQEIAQIENEESAF